MGSTTVVLTLLQLPLCVAADVVYLDAKTDTYLEEVSSCNIFVRKGKLIKTPPLSGTILPGWYMHQMVLRACAGSAPCRPACTVWSDAGLGLTSLAAWNQCAVLACLPSGHSEIVAIKLRPAAAPNLEGNKHWVYNRC